MADDLKTERIAVMMTPAEVQALDDWSFAHRIRSRGEAVRQLIQTGLKADAPEGVGKLPRRSTKRAAK
jgi:hypothetical protein